MNNDKALVLTDGTIFPAKAGFGRVKGQVVMVYSNNFIEVATDPSSEGLILVFSAPQAGLAAVVSNEIESNKGAKGVVFQNIASGTRGEELRNFFKRRGIAVLEGVDTREVALHLQDTGAISGELQGDTELTVDSKTVSGKRIPNSGNRLAVIDSGISESLIRTLVELGYDLTIYENALPDEFLGVNGILVVGEGLSENKLESLQKSDLPLIFMGEVANFIVRNLGGTTGNDLRLGDSYPVLEKETQKVWSVNFRRKQNLEKVPGEVLFLDLTTNKPVGFIKDKVIGLEFTPEKVLLQQLLRRVGL